MTRPPPAPLVVRPGRYRTRGGKIAVIGGRQMVTDGVSHPWTGSCDGGQRSWTDSGKWGWGQKESEYDLIARFPSPKKPKPQPAPGKRGNIAGIKGIDGSYTYRPEHLANYRAGRWIRMNAEMCVKELVWIATYYKNQAQRLKRKKRLPIGRGRGGK